MSRPFANKTLLHNWAEDRAEPKPEISDKDRFTSTSMAAYQPHDVDRRKPAVGKESSIDRQQLMAHGPRHEEWFESDIGTVSDLTIGKRETLENTLDKRTVVQRDPAAPRPDPTKLPAAGVSSTDQAQQQDQIIKGLEAARAKLKEKIATYKKEQVRVTNELHEQHVLVATLKSQNEGLKEQLELLKSERANWREYESLKGTSTTPSKHKHVPATITADITADI
eukprot:m51a1_g9686 hypothetical protein (224) ;mRNA; r:1313145-1328792